MTRLERWIYRDLIEVYYDTEEPLTTDFDKLCKDIGARTDEEKSVVREILDYKFSLTDRGYMHGRCETVIEGYRAKAETARENGKKGGRPPKGNCGNPEKPSGLSSVIESNQEETESKTNQKPETRNQKPEEASSIVSGTASREMSDDFRPKDAAEWLRHFRTTHGFEADPTNVNDRKKLWPVFSGWVNAGLSTTFVDEAVRIAIRDAKEPIVSLPLYVDRCMANANSARASPQRSYHDERADVIAQLTGRKAAHQPSDAGVIDVNDAIPRLGS